MLQLSVSFEKSAPGTARIPLSSKRRLDNSLEDIGNGYSRYAKYAPRPRKTHPSDFKSSKPFSNDLRLCNRSRRCSLTQYDNFFRPNNAACCPIWLGQIVDVSKNFSISCSFCRSYNCSNTVSCQTKHFRKRIK